MQLIAYAYTYRVEIQSDPFSGDGEIVSFDVNENGEVLICVEDFTGKQIHVMIFNVQGEILCSLLIYKSEDPLLHCAFQDTQNIALFPNRGSKIYVIDRLGNALYDYSNENINVPLIGLKSDALFQDIQFKRNKAHSQIVKIQDGVEEIFYEVGVGNRSKSMRRILFSIMHIILTVFIAGVIIIKNTSKKNRQEW